MSRPRATQIKTVLNGFLKDVFRYRAEHHREIDAILKKIDARKMENLKKKIRTIK